MLYDEEKEKNIRYTHTHKYIHNKIRNTQNNYIPSFCNWSRGHNWYLKLPIPPSLPYCLSPQKVPQLAVVYTWWRDPNLKVT